MASAHTPTYDTARIKLQSTYELRELLRYRFLVRNLIARDLKVRYKRSVLGFLWVMLNPLLMTAVLAVVFSTFIKFGGVHYYPAFLLGGILLYNLFAQGSVAAMSNLQGNGGTLRRMYIPPSVFVASSVGSALVNLVFAMLPFVVLALILGAPLRWTWVFALIPMLEMTAFTFGVGLIVAALMVFFNDIYEIYSVLLSVIIYLTPVFYPVTILPPWLRRVEFFNPLYLMLDTFRAAVLGGVVPPLNELLLGGGIAAAVCVVGWLFFTRLEGKFAYQF